MFTRATWTEVSGNESYQVIADLTANGWEFSEKSSWEIRWYPMATTPELVATAEEILNDSIRHYVEAMAEEILNKSVHHHLAA